MDYFEHLFEQSVISELATDKFVQVNVLGYRCHMTAGLQDSPLVFCIGKLHHYTDDEAVDTYVQVRKIHLDG